MDSGQDRRDQGRKDIFCSELNNIVDGDLSCLALSMVLKIPRTQDDAFLAG